MYVVVCHCGKHGGGDEIVIIIVVIVACHRHCGLSLPLWLVIGVVSYKEKCPPWGALLV